MPRANTMIHHGNGAAELLSSLAGGEFAPEGAPVGEVVVVSTPVVVGATAVVVGGTFVVTLAGTPVLETTPVVEAVVPVDPVEPVEPVVGCTYPARNCSCCIHRWLR
jgi:hypothetical protein